MVFEALFVFAVTTVSSTLLVALILRLSHKNSWYDQVDDRKIHSGDVPRLGGIGFAVVFTVAAVVFMYLTQPMDSIIRFMPCLAGICIIVIFGVWDDFRPLRPLLKLLVQVIAALCVIIPGFTFRRMVFFDGGLLAHLPVLSYPITLLWIVGMANAINLIDGVDGLAGGVSAIIALTFAMIFYQCAGTTTALLCLCLCGSIVGFLIFNAPIPKAKIFMGDGGSQFLGFTLALLPLLEKHDTVASLPLFYAAALLAIPIFDTTAAVWRRLRDRQSIASPDKSHVHHKLMNLGLSVRKIDIILLSLQLLLCALVFISLQFSGLLSLIILGIAYALAIAFFAVIHFINRKAVLHVGETTASCQ